MANGCLVIVEAVPAPYHWTYQSIRRRYSLLFDPDIKYYAAVRVCEATKLVFRLLEVILKATRSRQRTFQLKSTEH